MAIEYRLALAGTTPVDALTARAFPRPARYDLDGFHAFVSAGRNGYFDAISDDGEWRWEPPAYTGINFRLDKFADRERVVTNMVTVISRVLSTGPEDGAFTFNGDVLLLARFDGRPVKHRRATWWAGHPFADQLISDRPPAS
jgi:hypothetical protein